MPLENYPVWSFEPNWTNSLDESLIWQTDILTSITGAEQRRAMRYHPRREFEFEVAIQGDERTLLDNLLITYGAQKWYLPLWHDVCISAHIAAAGSLYISCNHAESSLLKPNEGVFITNGDPYDFEIAELSHTGPYGINLKTGLSRAWPAGTRVYPMVPARLTDQPNLKAITSNLMTSNVRFLDQSQPLAPTTNARTPDSLQVFRSRPLMTLEPNRSENLTHTYERMLETLDNGSSLPRVLDTAKRAFPIVEHEWTFEGRAELSAFYGILHGLRGRSQEIFMPTFMEDFQLLGDVANGASTINVRRCGYNRSGGPRPGRQYIVIEADDFRVTRGILSASESGQTESIAVDQAIGRDIPLRQVKRVSFLSRMRLNSDTVTITHHTDTMGAATCKAAFRAITNTRTDS